MMTIIMVVVDGGMMANDIWCYDHNTIQYNTYYTIIMSFFIVVTAVCCSNLKHFHYYFYSESGFKRNATRMQRVSKENARKITLTETGMLPPLSPMCCNTHSSHSSSSIRFEEDAWDIVIRLILKNTFLVTLVRSFLSVFLCRSHFPCFRLPDFLLHTLTLWFRLFVYAKCCLMSDQCIRTHPSGEWWWWWWRRNFSIVQRKIAGTLFLCAFLLSLVMQLVNVSVLVCPVLFDKKHCAAAQLFHSTHKYNECTALGCTRCIAHPQFLPHNSVSYRIAVTFSRDIHFSSHFFKWISLICVTFANVFVFIIQNRLTKCWCLWVCSTISCCKISFDIFHFASLSIHHHLHSWLHIHYARNLQCTQKENFIFCHNNCPFQLFPSSPLFLSLCVCACVCECVPVRFISLYMWSDCENKNRTSQFISLA